MKMLKSKKFIFISIICFVFLVACCIVGFSLNNKSNSDNNIFSNSDNASIDGGNSIIGKSIPITENGPSVVSSILNNNVSMANSNDQISNNFNNALSPVNSDNSKKSDNNAYAKEDRSKVLFTSEEIASASLISIPNVADSFALNEGENDLAYKLDESTKTLHIKNNSTSLNGEDGWTPFNSKQAAPWVKEDNMEKINYASIDEPISPYTTIGWFGCVTEYTPGDLRLCDIQEIQNLNKLDMSNVTDASFMFTGSDLLETPSVSDDWFKALSKVQNAEGMCSYTKKFSNVFLNSIANEIKDSVEYADFAFSDNPNLVVLDFGEDAELKLKKANYMFLRDSKLESITAKSLLADSGVTAQGMFDSCSALQSINLKKGTDWTTEGVITGATNYMFYGCNSLIGGGDTQFDPTVTDKTYARVGTADLPGYFTEIATPEPAEIKPLTDIDPLGNSVRYYPVFPDNNPPANVTFYSDLAGTQPISNVTTMSDLVDAVAYSANNGASFTVARCIYDANTRWDTVYNYSGKSAGDACEPNSSWVANNIIPGETLEGFPEVATDQTITPQINNVNIKNIILSYSLQDTLFYRVWSCVMSRASSPRKAYNYNMNNDWSGGEWDSGQNITRNYTLLISRSLS